MKAIIVIKVECFDSDPQMVVNFEISLYLTDLTDTPQAFDRNFEEINVFCTYSYADIYDQILENR